jgi:LL-diaminopimelate aminotransferase
MKTNRGFQSWNKPYLFREIEEKLRSFSKERRANLIPMGIGDPDLPTPAGIREAISREHLNRYYGYPSAEGRLDLREAIAEYYFERFQVGISPEQILVGMGAKTDLFDICGVFANHGDQVIILDPAYPVYCDSTMFRGQEILFLPGSPANNYLPPVNETLLRDDALALIYLCYPNNPTGALATREYVETMMKLARERSAMIIFDIAYADFVPGNKPSEAFSIFSIPGSEDAGIEVGSFSKPFSMTGDRISWVAIKNKAALEAWRRYRSNRDSGASNYDQAGALAALTDPSVKADVRTNMEIYGRRKVIFMEAFARAGIHISSLDNTPYVWFPSPIPDSRKAVRILLERSGLLLTPGAGFGPAGEGYLRATIFNSEEKLQEAVKRYFQTDFRDF